MATPIHNQPQPQPHDHLQKYTTVGSIYNPNATPLQPPTRRGRTVKWPPHADITTSRSSVFAARNQTVSPSTHPNSSLLRYSPLQQNSARAVSPTTSAVGSNKPAVPLSTSFSAKETSARPAEADMIEDQVISEGGKTLKSMSVKTLTNLASYPNPNQKGAQRLLSHRPSAPLDGLRGALSDPLDLTTPLGSDGVGECEFQPSNGHSIYDSILSSGLGAPQPLKAGPPGLRQHKSSHAPLEQNLSAAYITTDSQQPHLGIESATSRTAPSQWLPQQTRLAMDRKPNSRYNSEGEGPVQAVLGIKDDTNRPAVTDTLPADKAARYYANGQLPVNFSYVTTSNAQDWSFDYPLNRFGQPRSRSQDNMWTHQSKISLDWYDGSDMMNKTIGQALQEKNRRDLEHTIGINSEPKRRGKQATQKLSIPEAKVMPVNEHAAPLLSMAYQTLINHPEFTQASNLPKFPLYDI